MRILFLFNMLLCFVANGSAQSISEIYERSLHVKTSDELTIVKYKGPDGNMLTYGIIAGGNEAIVLPPKGKVIKCKGGGFCYTPYYADKYEYKTFHIPEKILYKDQNYTVTAIHQDALGHAFDMDNRITIIVPKSIKNFGYDVVCDSSFPYIAEIHVSDVNAFFCALNSGNGIINDQSLFLNDKLVTDYTIPQTWKKINKCAFRFNKSMKSLVISSDEINIADSAFVDCIELEEVEINTNGIIPNFAFRNCKKLKKVVIGPNVKSIGNYAFYDCNSLACAIIKDNPRLEICGGAFMGCSKLFDIQGLTAHTKVDENAFRHSSFSFENFKKNFFSLYAKSRLTTEIDEWQKKGEFETTAQWKQRVTKNTRDAKVVEIAEKLKQEFIAKGKSAEPVAEIQEYDADKSVFVVKIGQEEFYVKVPNDEAKQFKANFNPKGMQTKYDIANDVLKIVDVSYKYNGKVYPTTNNYSKADNLDYLALNLPPLEVNFGNGTSTTTKQNIPTDLTIDKNIPTTNIKNDHTFAVIIGNENYKSVSKVQYAQNDARSFAEYCKKTLGLPEKNVRGYEDATYGMMVSALQDIKKIANAYHGDINVIFYYAGHGIPDNSSKNAYLLPIDADGRQMDICLSLNKLYQDLGALEAKSVTVFLDACFSGALRGDGMLMAARGVAIKPKTSAPQGKMVIFSAATDEQTAFPYTEKGHGMFTYYLLKKIRDTNGDCTLGELGSYICNEVAKQSIVTNGREQTPSVSTSTSIVDSWKNLKLK